MTQVTADVESRRQRLAVLPPSVRVGLLALVVCGALLRTWQYSADHALWLDEIAIAKNVIQRPLGSLLASPLDYQQSAPKGFLVAEKLAVAVGGPTEYALRAWPFAASLASLLAFSVLAVLVLDSVGAVAAVACLAFAAPLIRQAAEVKQYSSDVAVAVLLMLLALPAPHRSRRFDVAAGVTGAVAIWFAQPAVLVASALLVVFAIAAWRLRTDPRRRLESVWRAALWTASAGGATLVAIASMTASTKVFMQRYWIDAFPPTSLSDALTMGWPWPALEELFGNGAPGFQNTLSYPVPAVYALLSMVGLVLLVRRGGSGAVVALPLVVTVAAAMARQYPFRDRLILFLLPCLLIGFGCAVSYIHRRLRRVRVELAVMVTALLMAGTLSPVIRVRPPYTMEDMKPIMAALTGAQGDHEAIYVHANAAAAFTYYAPRYGISPTSFTIGSCHFANGQALLRELDEFRGRRRLWVVLTHIIPPLAGERLDLLGYLDAIGHRRATITVPSRLALGTPLPAEAILYDLSDDEQLPHMTAERFTVSGTYLRTASRCAEGAISIVFGAGRSAP